MFNSPDAARHHLGKQSAASYPHSASGSRPARSNTVHTFPPNLSNVSQLWGEDVHHNARRSSDQGDPNPRMAFQHSFRSEYFELPLPRSWPPPTSNGHENWLGPVDGARLSSSPESVASSKTNLDLGSSHLDPHAWSFCPTWSLDASLKDLDAISHAMKDVSIQTSPSLDDAQSTYGSNPDADVWTGHSYHSSISTVVNDPGHFSNSTQTNNLFQPNLLSDAIESSLARLAIASAPIGSDLAFEKTIVDVSSQILAKSPRTSRLTKQLEKHQARQNRLAAARSDSQQAYNNKRFYIHTSRSPSFFPVETEPVYAQDRSAAVPSKIKTELYKTELCRNWEEKGFCDYNE